MKGSYISVRIADFLKEYPPFEFIGVNDLRELASLSKVKFHEDGEIVFSQGQPRDTWLYVIQKGSVRILEEDAEGEQLIDLRGAGDILGLQGIRTEEPYLHTCKTETETILYGLPRKTFTELALKSTRARRYLAAYFSLNPAYEWGGSHHYLEPGLADPGPVSLMQGGLTEVEPPQSDAQRHLTTVATTAPLREVVIRLQSKGVECVLVVDDKGRPLGKVSDADLRDRVLEGPLHPQAPVGELMFTDLIAAGPGEDTGQLLLKLARYGKHFLVVTEDGTLGSPATGMVSERNLFLQYGRFPTVVGEAIGSAPDMQSLRSLRDRLEALVLEFLDGRSSLKWLMEMVGVLNRKMVRRILELVLSQMVREGWGYPPVEFSWLMMGSGGRNELMIRSAVYHAIVYEDAVAGKEEENGRFFSELALRASSSLRKCGFLESPQNVLAQNPDWCLPLTAFKERFTRLIREPVKEHVYSARDAFDFQPLEEGPCPLAVALSRHIDQELQEHPEFIRHMASDSLMNQPPRTIFKGYVVDKEGMRRAELAIKSHALLPLVDVARVFTLESGAREPTSTLKRLEAHARRMGEGTELGDLFKEASEAFLVAQFARISHGLRSGTDGALIQPDVLSSEDRTLLITSFRTIVNTLEATAAHFNLIWRG